MHHHFDDEVDDDDAAAAADDEDAALGVLKAGGRTGACEDAGGAFGAAAAADLETIRILLPDLAGCAGREPASGRPPPLDAAAAAVGCGRESLHGGGASPCVAFGGGMLSTSKENALRIEPEWLQKR